MDSTLGNKAFKTRPLIAEAFIVLLETKPLDKISVKELCECAGVSRKTFYAHYSSVADVALDIQDEVTSEIESYLQTVLIDEYGLGPQYFFHFINSLYASNPRFFENLVCATNYHFMVNKCVAVLKEKLIEGMQVPEKSRDFVGKQIDFCLGGASAIYIEWVREGKKTPFEEITGQIAIMIMGVLYKPPLHMQHIEQ